MIRDRDWDLRSKTKMSLKIIKYFNKSEISSTSNREFKKQEEEIYEKALKHINEELDRLPR
jgi:hypothetical protein